MLMRVKVDFFEVEERHADIHRRLENWAVWCNGTGAPGVSPMFRLYRADNWERSDVTSIVVDGLDAQKIAKGVAVLPAPHRGALSWNYIIRSGPRKACQKLGTTMEGLAQLVRDGRLMLINRNV